MARMSTDPSRSALMKRVRREGTSAELVVRALLRDLGQHYRLNVSDLPGKPDIAHKGRRKAIFVNGCFWHYHKVCGRGRIPKTNREFWTDKLKSNRRRDQLKVDRLIQMGFDVLVIWECELKDGVSLRDRLKAFWN